ncbi:hypothetical protein [Clostridium sp. AF22-10]|uniref:hypothetical protein n=1 Tax=Clostridium sp. AF22-10 TaxID=2293004 RepID=UPI000E540175|nr:hypothetical protein DWX91_15170 [Clostridium sp. AF22-10]
MSSTKRSNSRDGHIADYYTTPVKDVELFLKAFNDKIPFDWNNSIIVDSTAGGNLKTDKEAYHPMSYPVAIKNVFGECDVRTYDIREDSLAEHKCDYLKINLGYTPKMIISNPPFFNSIPIIEKAIEDVDDDGYVVMLLRLNFFGGQNKEEFFNKYMPEWCFVHHKRISFTDKKDAAGFTIYDKNGVPKRGGTDSIEYMHAVWRKSNLKPKYTKLVLI